MNKISILICGGVICILLSSCTTIMHDDVQNIPAQSNVEKTDIRVFNRCGRLVCEGQTPTVLPLGIFRSGSVSSEEYIIEASKEGYVPIRQPLGRAVSLWNYLGHLLVDLLTDRVYLLDEEVNLYMTPISK